MADWPFVHLERVRFGDLDAMRHLNNVVFLRYFETARIAYLRDLIPGHDPAHPEAGGFGLIFAACEIAYRSPATFDEEVAIRCRAEQPGRSSFRVAFEMAVTRGSSPKATASSWATTTSRGAPGPCPTRSGRLFRADSASAEAAVWLRGRLPVPSTKTY
ncbi:MAG: acyl-CoA thioesterase [Thermoleophilaceae bacterium]